jgi:hypothetical protein
LSNLLAEVMRGALYRFGLRMDFFCGAPQKDLKVQRKQNSVDGRKPKAPQ